MQPGLVTARRVVERGTSKEFVAKWFGTLWLVRFSSKFLRVPLAGRASVPQPGEP